MIRNIKLLLICVLIVSGVAFIGSIFTSSETDSDWYKSIRPSITPPNWVFPIVWSVLFFLIAISLYLVWQNSKNKYDKRKVAAVFGINFFLNIFWSFLYFYLKNPFFAFIEIILLEISIVSVIIVSYKISRKAGYLLIPYLLWVGFATILNYLSIK